MKKLMLLTVCLVAFATFGSSQNRRGYKGENGVSSLGVSVGYAVDYNSPILGVDFRYNVLDRLRIAPSLLYVFENKSRSALYINADAHYLVRLNNKITIYPIGGLALSIHNVPGVYYSSLHTIENVTKNRLGLNFGFGVETRVTPDVIVGAEFKYNLTTERAFNQAMLLGRVAYYF